LFSAVHPARNADVFAKKAAKTEVVEQTLKNVNEEGTTTVMLGTSTRPEGLRGDRTR